MPDSVENPLIRLSEALAERAAFARALVVGIAVPGHRMRFGYTLAEGRRRRSRTTVSPRLPMPRSHWQTGAHSPRASPAATLGRMLSPCASTAPLIRRRLERVSRRPARLLSPLVPRKAASARGSVLSIRSAPPGTAAPAAGSIDELP
jgi:hypothetical protein